MSGAQRLNVLVVDTDEASGLELKDFLSREGFHPTLLSDPARAGEEVKQDMPKQSPEMSLKTGVATESRSKLEDRLVCRARGSSESFTSPGSSVPTVIISASFSTSCSRLVGNTRTSEGSAGFRSTRTMSSAPTPFFIS